MREPMNEAKLARENEIHAGTCGVSDGNKGLGFRPAFLDFATLTIYPSLYADGRPAPLHLLDSLPDKVVNLRMPNGRVLSTKPTIVAGFERGGFFYTRRAAGRAREQWGLGG